MFYFDRVNSFSQSNKNHQVHVFSHSVDYRNLLPNTNAKARIFGNFDDFNRQPLSDDGMTSFAFPSIYQAASFQTFAGAPKTYNEVITFNSNNPVTYYHLGWKRNYNVTEVWYDGQYGFI